MANVKLTGAKLPLLIVLPVLLVIGIAAVFLLPDDPAPQPNPPAPPPLINEPDHTEPPPDTDPLAADPNPRPRPKPKPGAPDSVEVAEAMQNEIHDALDSIRARLELKYKYAEYQLDRSWTLEAVMRKLERLDGARFLGTDYGLAFPEGEEPVAEITCATMKGDELPDGPLSLTVNLRTGKSKFDGRVIARDASGRVLVSDAAYAEATDILRRAAMNHAGTQILVGDDALAPFDEALQVWSPEPFVESDFSVGPVEGADRVAEFACRTVRGEELASPAVIRVDYKNHTATVSQVPSPKWMPLPEDREKYKESCIWFLRALSSQFAKQLQDGKAAEELSLKDISSLRWIMRSLNVLPFELKLDVSAEEPRKIALEISTSFGRALPFKRLRYVAQVGSEDSGYED